ncbi:MAG: drug efflux transport system ATP-binding protein [Moorella sp. (in: firmicutes)]|nr:drug efflux transport system ATP-binding protein [Moorella sp. (in: firmicutes)]
MVNDNPAMIIAARGLVKSFGPIRAVDHIDLQVEKGEIFGLVGPDGAGKTTTMRMLATILPADAGAISVLGYDGRTEAERIKEHIGYMPQRFSLYGDLTVMENLDFYAEIYGVSRQMREQRKKDLLEWANLIRHSYKLADQLSGGMKQKLALACNLIHEPAVLFLDEPSTGVDPVARRDFWRILFRLREEGATILVSTPYMDEAERCDRIAFTYNGRILTCGTPAAVKNLFRGQLLLLRAETIAMLHAARDYLRREQLPTDVLIYGDALHLVTDDALETARLLPGLLERQGIRVTHLQPIPPSLEDTFAYLVRQAGGFAGRESA